MKFNFVGFFLYIKISVTSAKNAYHFMEKLPIDFLSQKGVK